MIDASLVPDASDIDIWTRAGGLALSLADPLMSLVEKKKMINKYFT